MDDICLDKTLRLLRYIKALSELKFTGVKSYERYEKTLWIEHLRVGGMEAPLLGDASKEDFLFRFTLPEEPIEPKPSDDLDRWLDKGGEDPILKTAITDENGETLFLEKFPDIPPAFEEFLKQLEVYKKAYAEWFCAKQVYNDLFLLYQKWEQEKEQLELVCGVGLLQWGKICRPVVTLEVEFQFDAEAREFTLIPSERAVSVAVEIDMLDENVRSLCKLSEHKDFIETIGTDICDRETIGQFLTKFVHSLSADGVYDVDNTFQRTYAETPRISFTPGLFLRKRSSSGFFRCMNEIEDSVETTGKVPKFLKKFSEISDGGEKRTSDESNGNLQCRNVEIYFPKPSNEEQKKIVRKLEVSDCVVVQGPPGTGKSHTIANLICHLLAKEKRILITAKTERALKVLQNLLPEEFRQLSLSIIGNDREASDALAANVRALIEEAETFSSKRVRNTIEKMTSKLRNLREEEAVLSRKLQDGREAETKKHYINEHYFGTPTDIIRAMQKDREQYGWLEDGDLSLKIEDFDAFKRSLSEHLRDCEYFTKERISDIENCSYCSASESTFCALPSPETFVTCVDFDRYCSSKYRRNEEAVLPIVKVVLQKMLPTDATWLAEISDGLRTGVSNDSEMLYKALEKCLPSFEEHFPFLESLHFPEEASLEILLEDAVCLERHISNGGKLGFGWFRPRIVKRRLYLLQSVTINGRKLEEAEDFRKFRTLLELKKNIRKLLEDFKQKTDGTCSEQLKTLKHIRELLKLVLKLNLSDNIQIGFFDKKLLSDLLTYPFENFEAWENRENSAAVNLKNKVQSPLNAFVETLKKGSTIGKDLTDAFHEGDIERYKACYEKLHKLEMIRHLFNKKLKLEKERLTPFRKRRETLQASIPKMLEWVEKNCDSALCSERIENFQRACEWKQANDWIQKYLNKEDLKSLQARLRQIEEEKLECLKNLGKNYAKDAFFKRLAEEHCQHMNAYAMAVQKIGKGTGKKAQKWKADARRHLEECKKVVPAWIMPMDRVFDTVTFDTEEGVKFDVVIVDEASQCGIEGIPLFGFADKMIVIGDDKQISPENVGIKEDSVERLQKEYLFDYEFSTSFHPDSSLFDHAKIRFGSGITLREHFRCMPEIIRFSNDLCYSDTPLIPLRQFDQNRLPPLQSVFVEDGFREGDGQGIVNRPEAEAVCDKIDEICCDPAYEKKTIGVVILQGSAQADLIYQLLLNRLSAKILEERKIVCGNPYHFQGDERDVILLSMVAAPNERNGVLSKDTDQRRFNVAASRACDQMILFHSLRLEDCSPNDLRYRLIAFFEEKLEAEISNLTQSDLEYHVLRDDRSLQKPLEPFDSWFEADVALELLRKRLHVFSQYKVGFKRIDLVVESGNQRLAIECDGDYWHGAEQYEADMERQRQLERCGWEFFRIRQSEFYADKISCLEPLWQLLRHRGMM